MRATWPAHLILHLITLTPPSSAEVKNAWSYASHAFTVWDLVKHRDSFTLAVGYLASHELPILWHGFLWRQESAGVSNRHTRVCITPSDIYVSDLLDLKSLSALRVASTDSQSGKQLVLCHRAFITGGHKWHMAHRLSLQTSGTLQISRFT